MSYDVKANCIKIQGGRLYLPVAQRLVWFRLEHADWGIVTEPIEINMEKQYAIFVARIFNGEGKLMASATKFENVRGFGDFIEKCETGAVGRALAYCGYGTQFEPALDEGERLADAPQQAVAASTGVQTDPSAQEFASATAVLPAVAVGGEDPMVCCEPGCGNRLTQGQLSVSMGRYGKPLCLDHQKRSAAPRGSAANSMNGVYAHV